MTINNCDWRGLDTASQSIRYETIARMLYWRISVLDVGCGEAVLLPHLVTGTEYFGVEPGLEAFTRAKRKVNSRHSTIVHATAEAFTTRVRFDAIVFNEMLYYAADPVGLLRKYGRLLLPNGIILISIYQKDAASLKSRLWHLLDHRRPMSNIHCERMLRAFMRREGWGITEFRQVNGHHIWSMRPDCF